MKKLFSLAILCLSIAVSHAQTTYPIVQSQGAPKTLIISKGGMQVDSSLILPAFIDTASANISTYIKNYAGSIMRVGNSIYVRSYDATRWVLLSSGGVSSDSLAWHTNLNVGGESIKFGTNNNFGVSMYTNNIARLKIRADGINRNSGTRFKNLIIDTVNRELYYTDGSTSSGTVTSISQGYGITNTPNPITTTGTIKVDTATLSNVYLRKADTANKYVNTITRTPGKDSIIYYIGSTRYAIKDSVGTGTQNLQSVLDNGNTANDENLLLQTTTGSGANIGLYANLGLLTIQNVESSNYITLSPYSNTDPGIDFYNGIVSGHHQILKSPTLIFDSDIYLPVQTNLIDTLATLADVRAGGGGGSGTVTSVATGYGLSGGTITTSGTLIADTATLSTKYVRSIDTANKWVNTITRTPGKDSIIFYIGSTRYAIRDSISSGIVTPTGYHGAFQDTTTQTAAADDTGYPMTMNQVDLSNGVSVVSNSRITFSNTGVYNLQFSSQFQNTSASVSDVTIWLRKNGTDLPGSSGLISVPAKHGGENGHVVIGWNYLLSIVGGEYYEIVWSTNNHTAITMEYYAAGNPPPSTASLIVTATQQAGIMAGTGITAMNGLTGAVQTFAVDSTSTTFKITSSGTTHTFNIPDASASGVTRGLLSNTQYSTFNSKIGPSDTATMLSSYINSVNYGLTKSGQTVSADTSKLSTLYQTNLRVKYTDTAAMLAPYTRQRDTIPMFVFGAGSGAAGDTAAFSTSAIYGSFYNDFSDTIVLTSFRIGLQGTSPSINATIYFNDSLAVTAGATKIVNAGTTATNIYTGTSVTSLDNTKIPPGNWVWVQTGTVTTKPTFFALTIFGYKSRR